MTLLTKRGKKTKGRTLMNQFRKKRYRNQSKGEEGWKKLCN